MTEIGNAESGLLPLHLLATLHLKTSHCLLTSTLLFGRYAVLLKSECICSSPVDSCVCIASRDLLKQASFPSFPTSPCMLAMAHHLRKHSTYLRSAGPDASVNYACISSMSAVVDAGQYLHWKPSTRIGPGIKDSCACLQRTRLHLCWASRATCCYCAAMNVQPQFRTGRMKQVMHAEQLLLRAGGLIDVIDELNLDVRRRIWCLMEVGLQAH